MGHSRRVLLTVGIAVMILAACLGGVLFSMDAWGRDTSCLDGQGPLRSFDLSISPAQTSELAAQLRGFAGSHSFDYEILHNPQDSRYFTVWMSRADIKILASSPFALGEFRIDIYNRTCENPTPVRDLDDEVADLLALLREIPGASVVEVKRGTDAP